MGVLPWLHQALESQYACALDDADDLESVHDAVRDALRPHAAEAAELAEVANEAAAILHTIERASPDAVLVIAGPSITIRYPGPAGAIISLSFDFEHLALQLATLAENLGHEPGAGAPRTETVQ